MAMLSADDTPLTDVAPITVYWPHKNWFPVRVYYASPRGRIVLFGELANNIRLFHKLRPDDYLISQVFFTPTEQVFMNQRRLVELFELRRSRVYFLCNTAAEVEMAARAGLNAIHCNCNAFLDERIYAPRPLPKIYDAVSNARLAKTKRVPLARQVPNLALITGGPPMTLDDHDDIASIPHVYANDHLLSPAEVVEVLSCSKVGLSLSEAEGACLASSEYLLCGLPVVSTPSIGGRDIWYDADNSIICEPTPEAVAAAVRTLIDRLDSGQIEPAAIRRNHIALANAHRRNLIALLGRIFGEMGDHVDAERHFYAHFRNKLVWSDDASENATYAALCRVLDETAPSALAAARRIGGRAAGAAVAETDRAAANAARPAAPPSRAGATPAPIGSGSAGVRRNWR